MFSFLLFALFCVFSRAFFACFFRCVFVSFFSLFVCLLLCCFFFIVLLLFFTFSFWRLSRAPCFRFFVCLLLVHLLFCFLDLQCFFFFYVFICFLDVLFCWFCFFICFLDVRCCCFCILLMCFVAFCMFGKTIRVMRSGFVNANLKELPAVKMTSYYIKLLHLHAIATPQTAEKERQMMDLHGPCRSATQKRNRSRSDSEVAACEVPESTIRLNDTSLRTRIRPSPPP